MERGVLVLNTIASFLETGIGIWIFSKVFPKRERYGVPQQIVIYVWCFLTLVFFYFNFIKSKWSVTYIFLCIIFLIGHIVCTKFGKENNTLFFLCLSVMMFFLLARNSWYGYLANGMNLFGSILPPFFLFSRYQCSFFQAYLWEFFYLSSSGLLKLMYFIYASETQGIIWRNHMRLNTYESIGYKFLILGFIIILLHFFSLEYLLGRLLNIYKKRLFLATGLIWGFTYYMTMLGEDQFSVGEMTAMLSVTICLIIGLLLTISKSFIKTEKAEKNLYEIRNAVVEQQYQEMRKAYEQNRRFVHDQKHMIQYLKECLNSGDMQNAREFLMQYETNTVHSIRKTWAGISTLDFIMNIKYAAMERAGIVFEWKAEIDEIPIDEADFVVLMGNLFDNAIEAAAKCELEKRSISLSLRTVNQILLIQMENTSQKMPRKKQDRFITTKSDVGKHGWGIESMKHIVKKYNGDISFDYNVSRFCVNILLNTH